MVKKNYLKKQFGVVIKRPDTPELMKESYYNKIDNLSLYTLLLINRVYLMNSSVYVTEPVEIREEDLYELADTERLKEKRIFEVTKKFLKESYDRVFIDINPLIMIIDIKGEKYLFCGQQVDSLSKLSGTYVRACALADTDLFEYYEGL